jgi:hypothetical protein
VTDSVFLADGDLFTPTEHARGPWDPRALHGGAPAALIAAVVERFEPGAELRVARLGFDLLRPVPLAPLRLSTRVIRPGRRVQELAVELRTEPADGGELICRASALRVQAIAPGVPSSPGGGAREKPSRMGAPLDATAAVFALNDSGEASFATTTMEMRWVSDPSELGPGRVWMRMRRDLLPGQPASTLALLAGVSDFGNGVGAALPFASFLFINADLTIHLQRPPRGEWIGLDAHTLIETGGTGLAESVLYDEHGPVGRAFQTLVVQAR